MNSLNQHYDRRNAENILAETELGAHFDPRSLIVMTSKSQFEAKVREPFTYGRAGFRVGDWVRFDASGNIIGANVAGW